ncbi:L-seryl-tRNA(Sec) selenium transferase [Candidatus Vecturithrix granuli]|uniref:L-seryl-tRNA(Sec) selenium transferase n=1 Tax=Vecturithrix granuli TaxID=1499967 RepID=A0A081BUR9_VECG1|nr:L-seryl-tRNA(Sec) selenium transferase [Candidatus Vecturithrix granuli]
MNQHLLRQIPKVDDLLQNNAVLALLEQHPRCIVVEAIREALEQFRQAILQGALQEFPQQAMIEHIQTGVITRSQRHLKRVINGTGIIVHTNLGRSNLSQKAIEAVVETAGHYSNLEYDLQEGQRGSRYSHVKSLLCELLGCEDALVVNNNAAAVLLVLSTLGKGKEAIVSRGELVEIGGSFRIPDVMQQGGCVLKEVGTTNRTHLRDYEHALTENTAMILKVHTSNYRIVGFTKSVSLQDLKTLAVKAGVPLVEDMGSGLLIKLTPYSLSDEPTVQESLAAGVDVITFSGDKLLGGPQVGIIVGKKPYIESMKKHPLNRALRIDKMTLAALEATLMHYRDDNDALTAIPTLRAIAVSLPELYSKAERFLALLHDAAIPAEMIATTSQVGGGALPVQELSSYGIALTLPGYSPNQLEETLRKGTPPVIGRIVKDVYLLDVRTLEEEEFAMIVTRLKRLGFPGRDISRDSDL